MDTTTNTRKALWMRHLKWIIPLALILFVLIIGISKRNGFVRAENGLIAADSDMQNVHATKLFGNVKQQGAVTQKQYDMMLALTRTNNEKYGSDGAKALVLAIKEALPDLPEQTVLKLQQSIEAGYNEFAAAQRSYFDRARVYKDSLETFPGSVFAWGFPKKLTMEKIDRVISSAQTKADFAKGELSDLEVFPTDK